MLAEVVWRSYLPTFFGPFLRSFWPTSSIVKKPKFQVMLKWFSLFSRAWATYRSNIPDILTRASAEAKPQVAFLCDLFECYIPAIMWFERTKSSSSFDVRLNFVYIQLFLLSSLNCSPYVKVLSANQTLFHKTGLILAITAIHVLEALFSQFLAITSG